jgi:hypothetical protein
VPEPRIGVVGRDPSLPAAPDCSGIGRLVIDPLTVREHGRGMHSMRADSSLRSAGRHVV